MAKLKIDPKKFAAIFFILLMVGSTLAFAILNALFPRNRGRSIPDSHIIDFRLTPEEQQYLIARGFTVIDYTYPKGCEKCDSEKAKLEGWTQSSDGQILLQEIEGNVSSSVVTIGSINGQDIIPYKNDTYVQGVICKLLYQPPIWCVNV